MIITVMFKNFQKLKSKLTYNRDCSILSNDKFRKKLLSKLSLENISNTNNGLEKFSQTCIDVPDKLAPQKKKYNRGNNMPFMNKPLAQTHMKKSRLEN